MDKNHNMTLNAMCLHAVPELLHMSAFFSGFTQVLEKSMTDFLEAVDGKKNAIEPNSFFNDELDSLVGELIEEFHAQSTTLSDKYAQQFDEIQSSGGFDKAQKITDYLVSLIPGLKPLDQLLSAKNILAYMSLMTSKDSHERLVIKYLDYFSPVFIQMEVERKTDIEKKEKAKKAWFFAIYDGDVSLLEKLHDENGFVNEKTSGDTSPDTSPDTSLALAVKNDNVEVVQYLLSVGASPVESISADSPISIAIESNNASIVSAILKNGHEELKKVDFSVFFADYEALVIADEYSETLRLIFDHRLDEIDIKMVASKAIKNNSDKVLILCFDYGLKPDDEYRSDPLIFSTVDEFNLPALKIFLEKGANVNITKSNSQSLIERATDKNFKKMVTFLIESDVKVFFSNYYTTHAFLLKLSRVTGICADECLLLNLFDPAAYDSFGRTFLHTLSVRYGEEYDTSLDDIKKIIDTLINKLEIDINQTTEDGGDTALTLVNHESIFEIFLFYKPDFGLQLGNNKSVLSKMVGMFDGAAFSAGIKLNENPDLNMGNIPLLHFCFKYRPDDISFLIKQGANLNSQDANGLTVLQKYITDKELIESHLIEMSRCGADFSLNVKSGLPIFHALSAIYDGDIIKQVAKNADVNVHVSDANNNNAMMQALLAGNASALIALSELGVDVNQVNVVGGNPVVHAVYEDDVEMLNLLVSQCGAKTDIKLAGKSLIFIANMTVSYDVLPILNELDRSK